MWGTDCSGRLFSALVVLVRVSYRILLTWTQSWKQEDAVANQQADFSLHVHRLWNLTSVFLVVVCPIIPGCSFSGSSSLCKLTSHTHTLLYSHITFGGCCCPDPEICGGKATQSGLLLQIELDALCVFTAECYCKRLRCDRTAMRCLWSL